MDQVGPIIAAELERVKAELRRQKQYTYEARKSRDIWKRRAQERQARLEYRTRYRGVKAA